MENSSYFLTKPLLLCFLLFRFALRTTSANIPWNWAPSLQKAQRGLNRQAKISKSLVSGLGLLSTISACTASALPFTGPTDLITRAFTAARCDPTSGKPHYAACNDVLDQLIPIGDVPRLFVSALSEQNHPDRMVGVPFVRIASTGLCYVSVDKAGQPPDMETWDHIRTAVKWIIDTCVTADGIGGGKINVGDKDGLTVKVYAPNSPSYNQDLTAISLAAPQCSSSSTTVESSISSLLGCVMTQSSTSAWSIAAFWPLGQCPTQYCSKDADCQQNCGLGFRCGVKAVLGRVAAGVLFGVKEIVVEGGVSVCSKIG